MNLGVAVNFERNKGGQKLKSKVTRFMQIKKGMIVKPTTGPLRGIEFYVTDVRENGRVVLCQRQRIDGSCHKTYFYVSEVEIVKN